MKILYLINKLIQVNNKKNNKKVNNQRINIYKKAIIRIFNQIKKNKKNKNKNKKF